MLRMRLARLRNDESGSTMLAVVGLMTVTAIVGVTVANASVGALSYTSATRAAIQAQASADAGVDFALAALSAPAATCAPTYARATEPIFSVAISFTTSTTISSSTSWSTGCPTSSAKFIKILSTGRATVSGTGGLNFGNQRKDEAIYNYTPVATTVQGSGSASYSYSNGGINDVKLLAAGSGSADIKIRTATQLITCQTAGTTIAGSIYIGSGDFSTSNGCNINGSVYVSGSARIGSGTTVTGSVSAAGIGKAAGDYVGYIAGGTVTGNLLAGGMVTFDQNSKVNGSVVSSKLPTGVKPNVSSIDPSTRIGGNLSGAGAFTTWATRCANPNTWDDAGNACALTQAGGKVVSGAVVYNSNALTGPAAPSVPDWVDYNYLATDWTSLGFTVVTWPGDSDHCTIDGRTKAFAWVTALATYTNPVVIDARACTKLVFSTDANLSVTMKTNIAFIANQFSLEGLRLKSNDSTQRSAWFIVPDNTVNAQPTCTGASGDITIGNSTNIEGTVSALAYTPCKINNSSATWSGQMYSGVTSFNSLSQLTYRQVGLPRVNLDGTTTTTTTTSTSGSIGARVSVRNVS